MAADGGGGIGRRPAEWLASWEVCCLSHLPFQVGLFQRPHHWMARFARHCPVTWVTPVSWRALRPAAMRREGIVRAGAWGDDGGLRFAHVAYTPLSGRSERAMQTTARRMAATAREMGFGAGGEGGERRRRLVWLQYPAFHEAARLLEPDLLVVDVMDPYAQFARDPGTGKEAARRAIEAAHLVLAGGRTMAQGLEEVAGRRLRIVPSGVEIGHFGRARAIRDKRRRLAKLRIGYAGSVDERLDWELVADLVASLSDGEWVFAGPVRPGARVPAASNVQAPGPIPYAVLPEEMATWDVGILPFKEDALCRALSPTKVPEYLAAGLPVVATPLPDVVSDWGPHCNLPRSRDEWKSLLSAPESLVRPSGALDGALVEATWDAKWAAIVTELETLSS